MKFYGEIILLILLLITNGRIFFLQRAARDPAVIVAPIAVILSILQILAWNIDFFTFATFILSVIVLLSNFHAIFRYSEKLYIDHYSPLMYFWSILTVTASLALIAAAVLFAPLELNNKKHSITEEKIPLSGSFKSGFHKTGLFEPSNGVIRIFSPAQQETASQLTDSEQKNNKPAIIFFPDKTADTLYYKPYLQLLAQEGYTVYSGDFYSKDCRWIHNSADLKYIRRVFLIAEKLFTPHKYIRNKEFYNYNMFIESQVMIKFARDAGEENVVLVCDCMGENSIADAALINSPFTAGAFAINRLDCYKTPGFGTITQTDPLLAKYLQYQADYKMEDTKQMVLQTIDFIHKNIQKNLNNQQ